MRECQEQSGQGMEACACRVVLEKEVLQYPCVFPLPLVGSWQGLAWFSKVRKAFSSWLDNLIREFMNLNLKKIN